MTHFIMTANMCSVCLPMLLYCTDNYRQDGQGGGTGYPGSESGRYPGGGDSRGPGRDGFDRGGMMHRGRGMGRGMG